MRKQILTISRKEGLSHIGSCLTAYDVIKEIEIGMGPDDVFILDEGHAGLAYYVWLEEQGRANAEELFHKHGVHPNKDENIKVSSGSLGLAGSIALGVALGNRDRNVYCLTSDGALAEGIWWEVLKIKADRRVDNLKIYVNANGFSAYDAVDINELEKRVRAFCPDVIFVRTKVDLPELQGLAGHYAILK